MVLVTGQPLCKIWTLPSFSFYCWLLSPPAQFYARDLAQSQSLDMTEELRALAEIQAAIELIDRG
jgi:hypothetical protein